MTTKAAIITVITGTLGAFGFSLLFRINKKRIPFAVIGGFLACAAYALCCLNTQDLFLQNFIPALIATAYSEIAARIIKAPASTFLLPAVIPLVPGGKLYYTMHYIISDELIMFRDMLIQTLKSAAGIAVGVIVVSAVLQLASYKRMSRFYS